MKKILVCLFAAALMLLPMGAGAALQSVGDSDLAAMTGQAGVDIAISAPEIGLNLQSITWGDPDGFTGYGAAGYVNLSVPPLTMHIGVTPLTLSIDTGTSPSPSKTAVLLTVSAGTAITVDAFLASIYLDGVNAVEADYLNANFPGFYPNPYATLSTTTPDKCLGVVGISGLRVSLPQPTTIQISAH